MSLIDILQIIGAGRAGSISIGIVIAALTLLQLAPIRINPWSAIAKAIGKAINADVMRELETVKKTQQELREKLEKRADIEDARNADTQREKILRFNVELMRNEYHTREDYIEILAVIDSYEAYCKNHENYKNHRAVHAVANINRVYDERLKKNDFYKAEESGGGV